MGLNNKDIGPNIFSANLRENNKVEQIELKKFKIYTISGLSIDQDIQSNVSLTNTEGKKSLSDILRTHPQEKKLTLTWKLTVPIQKRTDVLINGFKYYGTTTQKQETIDFDDYHYHLKNYEFTCEHSSLEFKYEIALPADEKTLTKKITMGQTARYKNAVDMSRIFYANEKMKS